MFLLINRMFLPIFKLLIVIVFLIVLYKLHKRLNKVKETFSNDPPKISNVIGGQHCPSDDLVFDIDKRADGVKGNECFSKKCNLMKCWYLQQIEKDSSVYKASPENFTLLHIPRDDDKKCKKNNDTDSIYKYLKNKKVIKNEINYYEADTSHVYEETNFDDDLKRFYFAFHIDENDELTKNFQINLVKYGKIFFDFTKKIKFILRNEKDGFDKDLHILCKGNMNAFDEINLKRNLNSENKEKEYDLTNIVFNKGFMIEEKDENTVEFQIVYIRSKETTITEREIKRFGTYSEIIKIEKDENIEESILKNIKWSDVDCKNIIYDTIYWKHIVNEDNGEQYFEKIQYIKDENKCQPEQKKVSKECNSDERSDANNICIPSEYKKKDDKYVLSFDLNDTEVWYKDAIPANKKSLLSCTDKQYISKHPTKKDLGDDKFIYITDRECSDLSLCNENKIEIMKFKIDQIKNFKSNTLNQLPIDINISTYTKCSKIVLRYTVKSLLDDNKVIIKSLPVFIFKKNSKEVLSKIAMEIQNTGTQIEKSVTENVKASIYFEPFNMFTTDKIELYVDTGTFGVELINISGELHCEVEQEIRKPGNEDTNNTCGYKYDDIEKCEYKSQFYDKANDFICKDYTIEEQCRYKQKKSDSDIICPSVKDYDVKNKEDKYKLLFNSSMVNPQLIDDCVKECNERFGCAGTSLNTSLQLCEFFGHETMRISLENGHSTKPEIKLEIQFNEDSKEEHILSDTNKFISFKFPVHIKSIKIFGPLNKATLSLFDYNGKVQKEFVGFEKYRLSGKFNESDSIYYIDNLYNKDKEMLKCVDTREREVMKWKQTKRVKSETEARSLCKDYKYMSLECPTEDGFEVWCANDISKAHDLPNNECKGDVKNSKLHNGSNLHCKGPYKWDNLNGGGATRGSLYKV